MACSQWWLGARGKQAQDELAEAVGSFIGAVSNQAKVLGAKPSIPRKVGKGGERVQEDPHPRAPLQSCLSPCSSTTLR